MASKSTPAVFISDVLFDGRLSSQIGDDFKKFLIDLMSSEGIVSDVVFAVKDESRKSGYRKITDEEIFDAYMDNMSYVVEPSANGLGGRRIVVQLAY